MKVRPSIQHYCEGCDETLPGRPQQTKGPVFHIGCCFDIYWEGTREQATELYDYLYGQGYLRPMDTCANGCVDSEIFDETGWACGVCGRVFSDDDYGSDSKANAINCCAEKVAAQQAEMLEEENI